MDEDRRQASLLCEVDAVFAMFAVHWRMEIFRCRARVYRPNYSKLEPVYLIPFPSLSNAIPISFSLNF